MLIKVRAFVLGMNVFDAVSSVTFITAHLSTDGFCPLSLSLQLTLPHPNSAKGRRVSVLVCTKYIQIHRLIYKQQPKKLRYTGDW